MQLDADSNDGGQRTKHDSCSLAKYIFHFYLQKTFTSFNTAEWIQTIDVAQLTHLFEGAKKNTSASKFSVYIRVDLIY